MPARLVLHALAGLRDLLLTQARGWARSVRAGLGRAWAARPAGQRAVAMVGLLSLAAASSAALELQAGLPSRLPRPLDWQAAGALLARDARPGDVVVAAPAWLERLREVAPQGFPVLAPARLEDEPLAGARRAWLVAAPDAPLAGWDVEAALGRRAVRADPQRLGGLEVTRFDLSAPVLPLASLAELAAPGLSALREAGGLPRRCLVLAPRPGAPLVLPFPAARIGRTLSGHAGLLPGAGGAPVRVAFQVDGVEAGALEVGPGDGWRPFKIDTGGGALGPHDLTVVATAAGDAVRPVCLEALALP